MYRYDHPSDVTTATGFCMLHISLDGTYYCYVYPNYYNNHWTKEISEALKQKRQAHFMLDTSPIGVQLLNGFSYGLDFAPSVKTVGFGYYALIVCIKR